jgi:hypothetical protein
MKRLFFTAILIIAISCAAVAREFVASGKSYTALGDYKIEKADKPFTMNGKELRTYVISYQNYPMEITVVIKKGNNCQNYIVLSDKLSIQYVCNDSYFGVEKLDKSARKEGFTTSDAALNRTEYFRQKVLCPGNQGEVLNTQLIASFFPMLLKEQGEPVATI